MTALIKAAIAVLLLAPSLARADLPGDSSGTSQKLDPNVHFSLPEGLELRAYPMPVPGASNYRVDTGSMHIAITGIPLRMMGAASAPRPTSEQLKASTLKGAAQYLPNAANPDASPSQLQGSGWTATYVTYAAKAEVAGFVPFMGAAYQCVSSGQVATASTIFVFTVGSSGCSSAEHQDFLKALETISVDG